MIANNCAIILAFLFLATTEAGRRDRTNASIQRVLIDIARRCSSDPPAPVPADYWDWESRPHKDKDVLFYTITKANDLADKLRLREKNRGQPFTPCEMQYLRLLPLYQDLRFREVAMKKCRGYDHQAFIEWKKNFFQVPNYEGCEIGWVMPQATVENSPDKRLYDRPPNAAQDAPQDAAQEALQNVPQDALQNVAQDAPRNVAQNAPQDESADDDELERFLREVDDSPNSSKAPSNPFSAGTNAGMTTGRDSDESSEGLPSLDSLSQFNLSGSSSEESEGSSSEESSSSLESHSSSSSSESEAAEEAAPVQAPPLRLLQVMKNGVFGFLRQVHDYCQAHADEALPVCLFDWEGRPDPAEFDFFYIPMRSHWVVEYVRLFERQRGAAYSPCEWGHIRLLPVFQGGQQFASFRQVALQKCPAGRVRTSYNAWVTQHVPDIPPLWRGCQKGGRFPGGPIDAVDRRSYDVRLVQPAVLPAEEEPMADPPAVPDLIEPLPLSPAEDTGLGPFIKPVDQVNLLTSQVNPPVAQVNPLVGRLDPPGLLNAPDRLGPLPDRLKPPDAMKPFSDRLNPPGRLDPLPGRPNPPGRPDPPGRLNLPDRLDSLPGRLKPPGRLNPFSDRLNPPGRLDPLPGRPNPHGRPDPPSRLNALRDRLNAPDRLGPLPGRLNAPDRLDSLPGRLSPPSPSLAAVVTPYQSFRSLDWSTMSYEEFKSSEFAELNEIKSEDLLKAPFLTQLTDADMKRIPDDAFSAFTAKDCRQLSSLSILTIPQWANLGAKVGPGVDHPAKAITKDLLVILPPAVIKVFSKQFLMEIPEASWSGFLASHVAIIAPYDLTQVDAKRMVRLSLNAVSTLSVGQMKFLGSDLKLDDPLHPRYGMTKAQFDEMAEEVRAECFSTWFKHSSLELGQTLYGGWASFLGWFRAHFSL